MVDRVICGSDVGSVVHLESYRGYLMSQLSRQEVIDQLLVAMDPDIFSDPPEFQLESYLRDEQDKAIIEEILTKHEGSCVPRKKKMLLEKVLLESNFDPTKMVSFTTNSNMVYDLYKKIDPTINWYFTKVQNISMFHI